MSASSAIRRLTSEELQLVGALLPQDTLERPRLLRLLEDAEAWDERPGKVGIRVSEPLVPTMVPIVALDGTDLNGDEAVVALWLMSERLFVLKCYRPGDSSFSQYPTLDSLRPYSGK